MKILKKYLFPLLMLILLGGCATTTKQTPESYASFSRGEARLSCGVSCSGSWGYSRKQAKSFYEYASWADLSKLVIEIGYENQLSYFYLGRAAEGLGYVNAARIYYSYASSSKPCDALLNNCDGFNFPAEINLRLASLPRNNISNNATLPEKPVNYTPATSKAKIQLPDGWEQKELLESMKAGGGVLYATNRTTDSGVLVSTLKRSGIADIASFAKTSAALQASGLNNGQVQSLAPKNILGLNAWQMQVTGSLKSGSNREITYYKTLFDAGDEIVIVNLWTFSANFDNQKDEYQRIISSIGGIGQSSAATMPLKTNVQSFNTPQPILIPPQSGKRLALVIGNASYKTRPLDNPINDADDVSLALRQSGFEVIDVRNATLAQMRSSIRQFGDKLLISDVGLVYYSGHGIEVKGQNYLIPVNADIRRSDEVADQSLNMGLILEKMETAQKGVNILIVDACRDDPFGRSYRSASSGLAQVDAPRGTIVAFATSPGKVAADGQGRNSPYTKNLVKAMQVPNTPIEQVFKQVRRAVQDETKNQQTPWENTSLSGDFYFSVKK